MAEFNYDEEDEPGFFQRYRLIIIGLVILLLGSAIYLLAPLFNGKPGRAKPPEPIAVRLIPPPPQPPPPPPPKPPPPPPQQPKMIEQPPVKPDEAKPKPDMKAPDRPPGPPGPPATGPASDFGLAGGGGGGGGDGGGSGSKYGWYASEVSSTISQAIRKNDKTREARARVKVRVWVDSSGHIVRSKLSNSSDDSAVDAALHDDVLQGLTLPEPPPSDMPMPIVLLVSETRPN